MKSLISAVFLLMSGCGYACFTTGPYCYESTEAVYTLNEAAYAPMPWAAQGIGECLLYIPCRTIEVLYGSCSQYAGRFPMGTIPCTQISFNMIQCQAPIF